MILKPERQVDRLSRLINVGYGNMVNSSKIVSVINADSSPVRRMVQNAREEGTVIDATQGRKTQGVLIMENGLIVLSALLPETLAGRFNEAEAEKKICAEKANCGQEINEEG
jgi:hypothetical protein